MIKEKKSILVIGANGFIGSKLVEKLWNNGRYKYKVVAGIHSWVNAARVARFPIGMKLCDVLDKNSLKQSMNGIDIVINCSVGDKRVIVDGTRLLIEALGGSGIKKLIHLSSVAVYGKRSGRIRETDRPQPVNNYGRAKLESEKYCMSLYRERFPVTILRPSIVYGPFSETWTMSLGKTLAERKMGISGLFNGKCNLLHVDDLIEFILLSINSQRANGIFNVNGGEIITWNKYFTLFNQALGLPPLPSIDSLSLLTHKFFPLIYRLLPPPIKKVGFIKPYSFFYHVDLKLFGLDADYSINKAKTVLGFSPKIKVYESLKLISGWMRSIGYI